MKCPSCGHTQATCIINNYWDCPAPGCKNYSGSAKPKGDVLTAGAFDRLAKQLLDVRGSPIVPSGVWKIIQYKGYPPPAPTNPNWPPHIPQFDMTRHVWVAWSNTKCKLQPGNSFACGGGRPLYRTPVEAANGQCLSPGPITAVLCLSGLDGSAIGWVVPTMSSLVGRVVWVGMP